MDPLSPDICAHFLHNHKEIDEQDYVLMVSLVTNPTFFPQSPGEVVAKQISNESASGLPSGH